MITLIYELPVWWYLVVGMMVLCFIFLSHFVLLYICTVKRLYMDDVEYEIGSMNL